MSDDDIELETYRAPGQGVNESARGVRAKHLPTGMYVDRDDARSQHQNRRMALALLAVRVAQHETDALRRDLAAAEAARDRYASDLSRVTAERDEARADADALEQQLRSEREAHMHAVAEGNRLRRERDEARAAVDAMRARTPTVAGVCDAIRATLGPLYREWRRALEAHEDAREAGADAEVRAATLARRRAAEDALEHARAKIARAINEAAASAHPLSLAWRMPEGG